ncbi:Na+/H+ antiporter NhaA [Erythrobacter sp. SCSIO 43205]|uniref:Na+/H+ antiporter NhaA n=1 Tax=Erythrobacter sp. SCSIO 43205 TaxID=2779361 RepID=UPI001CA84D80|nr:Na+/H+ antiporter NhaA [Erythrobacter sp. SCSIO 43205]UAB79069.1 Na+/H+ antiporter NhaA [Erythrobacter sp. SCSIO 43205]
MSDIKSITANPLKRLFAPVRALFIGDASAGVLLILVAAAAMLAANSAFAQEYDTLINGKFAWYPHEKLKSLHYVVNDGLMAVFFFVVGLEVKREMIQGQLASASARRLPMIAAAAGMVAPAIVFMAVSGGGDYSRGWAIPAATDIAFAMGVLGLLGNRVPGSLRIFLLTVAIVDDIGAVLVIAFFYTEIDSLSSFLMWMGASAAVLALMMVLNWRRVSVFWPYILLAIVLWFCVLNTGIHATIAGVLAALTIPLHRSDGNSMLEKLEHGLAPWSAYLVVPIFGFANAGVSLDGIGLNNLLDPLPIAIAAGLVVGKQVGIFSAIFICDKTGFAPRPDHASWQEIWGITILCGIGFTMSLFIGLLAFPGNQLLIDEAKIGILTGSAISAVLGFVVLRLSTEHPDIVANLESKG